MIRYSALTIDGAKIFVELPATRLFVSKISLAPPLDLE